MRYTYGVHVLPKALLEGVSVDHSSTPEALFITYTISIVMVI